MSSSTHFARVALTLTLFLGLSSYAIAQTSAGSRGLNIVISELDADQDGTDAAEFVELYDGGGGGTSLDGLLLVLVNGSTNLTYEAFDLDGQTTNTDGFFVLCGDSANVPNCDLDVSPATNLVQNGQDAAMLFVADAADIPDNTDISTVTAPLLDAMAYGTSDARSATMLAAIGETVQFDEDYNSLGTSESLQRLDFFIPPTSASASNAGATPYSDLFYAFPPTPGAHNPSTLTVNQTGSVDDIAGWRMLSTPLLVNAGGGFDVFDVDDYAPINLIQGVPGGTNPAQYPAAAPNFFPTYFAGSYFPPADTDAAMPPGQGFFWYWYDNDAGPWAGGTSQSYDLANPLFQLELTGVGGDELVFGGPASAFVPTSPDGFYMLGNPFAYAVYLGATSVSDGTLSTVGNVWNPTAASYDILTADFGDPTLSSLLPVWNGIFAEVTGTVGPFLNFTTTAAFVDPTMTPSLIGRTGAPESRISLSLSGETSSGTHVEDLAAMLRFREDATIGWDQHDGSKLVGPASEFALIAPVGERDGLERRQSARSLPLILESEIETPVAFFATNEGTYEIAWNMVDLPQEWFVVLRDRESGAEIDMLTESAYTFVSDATVDWTNRFEVIVSTSATANEPDGELPNGYALSSVYPNPFNPQARFTLQVAEAQDVAVAVYDLLGRRVMDLHRGPISAGTTHAFSLNGSDLASGSYVVRIVGESFSDTRRVTLLK